MLIFYGALMQTSVAALFLAGVAAACALYSSGWDVSWTKWRHRYDEAALDSGPLEGIALRTVLITVGVLMAIAVVSLTSRKESWMTRFGQRTLYCYLLHGVLVKYLEWETDAFPALRDLGSSGIALTIVGGVVLALLLMTKPVAVAFRPLFESKLDWAFRSRDRLPG